MTKNLKYIALYLLTMVAFFAVDLVWLGIIADEFYASELGPYLAEEVNWLSAILFYSLYICGILFFVTIPAFKEQKHSKALIKGAFFGLITYGTYDLTNLALIKDWPLQMSVVDIIWGVLLNTIVGWISYLIMNKLFDPVRS